MNEYISPDNPNIESDKPIDQMTNFEKVVEIAKKVKLDWVEKTDRGDMPPTVFVERGNDVVAIVMAPQVDRDAALIAAAHCRKGFKATAMTLIMDAHVRMEKMPEGVKDLEEAEKMSDFLKKYKHGDMQKACDEEGACERGDIADCLICTRIDDQDNKKCWIMPYSYHGKKEGKPVGGPFKWMPEHPATELYNKDDGKSQWSGYVFESLQEIMKMPALLDEDHQLINLLKKAGEDLGGDKQQYHVGRAILRVLQEKGYSVLDLQKHPDTGEVEPIMPLEPTVSLRDLIPEDAGRAIGKLLKEIDEPEELKVKIVEVLKPHQEAINAAAEKHEIDLKSVDADFIAEQIAASLKAFKKHKAGRPKPPFKVKVWNGDQSKYLGEGTYVGDVPVYFIAMPDGSIRSAANAEERPSDQMIAEMGGELIEAGDNPKIVMDEPIDEDGRNVVYGCQVWWQPADEPAHHEHHEGCGCGHDH
jgi:hypothetical protein